MSRPYHSVCAYCGHVHERATAVTSATDALAAVHDWFTPPSSDGWQECRKCGDHSWSTPSGPCEPKMQPGVATMCVGCGTFNIVAADGTLRKPTAQEQDALDHDPLAQIVRGVFQRVRPPLN